MIYVSRQEHFNAAHKLHNPKWSDERNREVFGPCANVNWHGHNYTLDVSVEGPIDSQTGYVLDLGRLRDIVERDVIDVVDHRNFNLDVDFMKGVIPTSENIILAFWKILSPALEPALLKRLVLWETENNYVEYTGS